MSKKRLYQQIGEQIRDKIIQGVYPVGTKLPPERLISDEFSVSRTVVREAVIMLELEGYVEVRKGSGIHVLSIEAKKNNSSFDETESFIRHIANELKGVGPFEMLQARQLIECSIAGFAASQVTKSDIDELNNIQQKGYEDSDRRDSEWDKKFHQKIGDITNNSVLSLIVELMWFGRNQNPLWLKLHEHIEEDRLNTWDDEHNEITKGFTMKSPELAKKAMWSHLESTKNALYNASSVEDNHYDKFLFQDDPIKYT
ncbi:GntR family transcriptional regulator [Vibrio algarum]|uniref:GntR family transcriptional regulator n=1 Tax=Vibrio algarum TaxID=3020714 RepID=A0ABT4YWN6_9VIBR|nr:GntR family transcriptional regulator [Vibrio sp. KJ40-1]MDB1125928.1 GntR family transcriptional regulator [Vibrio sp. KJ40-1]